MTRQILTMKPSLSVSIKSKKIDNGRTPSFPLSILSNIIAEALKKSELGGYLRHLPHLLSQSFLLYCPYMTRKYYQSLTTNILCLDFGQCRKFTSPFWWSKLKTSWSACDGIISKLATADFLGELASREPKDVMFFPDPDNIGVVILVFSSVALISNIGLLTAEAVPGEPNYKEPTFDEEISPEND